MSFEFLVVFALTVFGALLAVVALRLQRAERILSTAKERVQDLEAQEDANDENFGKVARSTFELTTYCDNLKRHLDEITEQTKDLPALFVQARGLPTVADINALNARIDAKINALNAKIDTAPHAGDYATSEDLDGIRESLRYVRETGALSVVSLISALRGADLPSDCEANTNANAIRDALGSFTAGIYKANLLEFRDDLIDILNETSANYEEKIDEVRGENRAERARLQSWRTEIDAWIVRTVDGVNTASNETIAAARRTAQYPVVVMSEDSRPARSFSGADGVGRAFTPPKMQGDWELVGVLEDGAPQVFWGLRAPLDEDARARFTKALSEGRWPTTEEDGAHAPTLPSFVEPTRPSFSKAHKPAHRPTAELVEPPK